MSEILKCDKRNIEVKLSRVELALMLSGLIDRISEFEDETEAEEISLVESMNLIGILREAIDPLVDYVTPDDKKDYGEILEVLNKKYQLEIDENTEIEAEQNEDLETESENKEDDI